MKYKKGMKLKGISPRSMYKGQTVKVNRIEDDSYVHFTYDCGVPDYWAVAVMDRRFEIITDPPPKVLTCKLDIPVQPDKSINQNKSIDLLEIED